MKIKEQVLSRKQMAHLRELGVDTSDASLCWRWSNEDGGWVLGFMNPLLQEISNPPHRKGPFPAYTIGDLIEKLPKHFYIKEAQISMVAINGSGAFQVWYDKVPKSCKSDGTIKNALYKLLCWVAENHKELLEVKK